MVNNYDVLCFVETKTDDCDQIEIPGFQTVYMQNRSSMSNRRSGGIALYVKNSISSYVKVLITECDFILWFEMKGIALGIDNDIAFGIVYIPPENSRYSSPDAFSQIENELLTISAKYEIICLTGDFNSRISNDDCIFSDTDNTNIDQFSDVYKLELLNVCVTRKSMDTKKNNYGNMLSALCKFNNLYILNGRVGEDRHVGKFTCKHSSVVDYCIGNSEFLGLVNDFRILDFCRLFSDVHCPLSIILKTKQTIDCFNESGVDIQSFDQPRKWDGNKRDDFCNNININTVHELHNYLCNTEYNVDDKLINIAIIDELFYKLSNLFLTAAKNTFGISNPKRKQSGKYTKSKPWFTKECKTARQNYKKAKRLLKKYGSTIFKDEAKKAERCYKKMLDKSLRNYRFNMKNKLKKLRSTNPKDYWKILNTENKHTKQNQKNIDIDSLYDYFKQLNSDNDDNEEYTLRDIMPDISSTNAVLNSPITAEEIKRCITNMKNNKSSGNDLIFNEYITSTCDILLPVYVKLFNIIFDTGIIPTSWLEGNVIPVYKKKGNQLDPRNYRPITLLNCMGKLFTSIINNRLTVFSEQVELICKNQSGFRKGYSTIDNIFVLYILIELLKVNKKICIVLSLTLKKHLILYGD